MVVFSPRFSIMPSTRARSGKTRLININAVNAVTTVTPARPDDGNDARAQRNRKTPPTRSHSYQKGHLFIPKTPILSQPRAHVEDGPRDESYERLIKELDAMIEKLDSLLTENSS